MKSTKTSSKPSQSDDNNAATTIQDPDSMATDEKDDTISAPKRFLTAQQRKRQLLQERRKQQNQNKKQKTSNFLPTENPSNSRSWDVSSSSSLLFRRIHTNTNHPNNIDQISTDDKDKDKDKDKDCESSSNAPTKANHNRKSKASSLFGAVMDRTSPFKQSRRPPKSSDNYNYCETQEKNTLSASDSLKLSISLSNSKPFSQHDKDDEKENDSNDVNDDVKVHKSDSNSNSGYSLWRVLDSIHNAHPSTQQQLQFDDDENSNLSRNLKNITSQPQQQQQHDDDGWLEVSLGMNFTKHDTNINNQYSIPTATNAYLDWTLFKTMKLDCFPAHPLSSFLTSNPLHHPSSSSSSSRTAPDVDISRIEVQQQLQSLWKSALSYYQHPAQLLDPHIISFLYNNDSTSNNNTTLSFSRLSKSKATKESKQPHPLLKSLQSIQAYIEQHPNHHSYNLQHRWKEWQSAFRDLFFHWWYYYSNHNSNHKEHDTNDETYIENKNENDSTEQDARNIPYFYMIPQQPSSNTSSSDKFQNKHDYNSQNNQKTNEKKKNLKYHPVILFRYAITTSTSTTTTTRFNNSHSNSNSNNNKNNSPEPIILCSNLKPDMAQDLIRMGITLHNYHHSSSAINTKQSSHSSFSKSNVDSNQHMLHTKYDAQPLQEKSLISSSITSPPSFLGKDNITIRKEEEELESTFTVNNNNSNSNSDYQHELEALRFASSVQEETAGAEVFIKRPASFFPSSLSEYNVEQDEPQPICIQGVSDCFAFYEYILNQRPKFEEQQDVALLLTRSVALFSNPSLSNSFNLSSSSSSYVNGLSTLGKPTSHATYKSLTVQSCPTPDPPLSQQSHNHSSNNESVTDSKNNPTHPLQPQLCCMEIKGYILPCAVQQIHKTLALALVLDKYLRKENDSIDADKGDRILINVNRNGKDWKTILPSLFHTEQSNRTGKDEDDDEESEDENVVGSHYFVTHFHALNGGTNFNGWASATSAPSSLALVPNSDNKEKTLEEQSHSSSRETSDDNNNNNEHHQNGLLQEEGCWKGHRTNMMVWNVIRPNTIMYKTQLNQPS